MLDLLNKKLIVYTIFAVVIGLFYGNTLTNGFVHDDVWQIQTNNNIKSIQSIPKIFTGCIGEDLVGKCNEKGYYYRPLQNIAYLITFQISQDPWAFHLANLGLLFILSCVIYLFFKLLLGKWEFAFFGTILFLINPIISEVVNWVSAVPELLMSIFIILSLSFSIKFSKSAKITQFVLSMVFLFLGFLSKETAVFLVPLVLVALSFEFKVQSSKLKVSIQNLKFLLGIILSLGTYFVIRSVVLGRVVYEYEGYHALTIFEQVLNAFYFYGKYILKLIFPLPLSFQELILPVKVATPGVAAGILLSMINVSLIVWFFKKGLRILVLGLLMINLSILPALVFINKIGEFLFSERYLFFASIGLALFLTELLRISLTTRGWKAISLGGFGRLGGLGILTILGILGAVCFFVVFNRNKDWKDNITSYSAMVRLEPSYARAYFQRGELYLNLGNLPEAEKDYKKALDLDPGNLVYKQRLSNFPIQFRAKNGIEFLYPKIWKLSEEEGAINIESSSQKGEKLNIEILLVSVEDLKEESHGKLAQEGEALIPNFEKAYVKVWELKEKDQLLEFFLFKGSRVVKVLVSPANSALMSEFDRILGSIKIQNDL